MSFDPYCLVHGKPLSQHDCLYCCLCFRDLTPELCSTGEDGKKQDICEACANSEAVRAFRTQMKEGA